MAKKKPLQPLYTDTPLDTYGETPMAQTWLYALDSIIPATPSDFVDLFRIIGPDGDPAAQNQRVASILGVNVRTVQRYRRAALGLGGETRGMSQPAQRRILAILGPIARNLIIRRFMQLTEIHGLAGVFDGAFHISKSKVRTYHHAGGVPAENMSAVVENAFIPDWEAAAWEYWKEWLYDWGIPDPDALEVNEVDGWELSLGYPPTDAIPDTADWWADETLYPYGGGGEAEE